MVVWRHDCIALIPCLNEAATIHDLVHEVQAYLDTVLVIDDGSDDDTAARAACAGAAILQWNRNRGKGHAILAGLREARRRGAQWCLTLDGDGQHLPQDIPRLFDAGRQGARLVIGNRLHAPKEIPFVRRWTNSLMSRALSQYLRYPIPDSQCGFRLIHLDAWQSIAYPFTASRFEIESEILLAFLLANQPVAFVPIHVVYRTKSSHIAPLADTWRWIRWWHKVYQLKMAKRKNR